MKLYEKFCFSWGKKLVNLQYAISHVPWSLVSVQPTKILFIIHIRILQEHFPWNFIVQEINDFEKCSKKGPYVPKNLANDFRKSRTVQLENLSSQTKGKVWASIYSLFLTQVEAQNIPMIVHQHQFWLSFHRLYIWQPDDMSGSTLLWAIKSYPHSPLIFQATSHQAALWMSDLQDITADTLWRVRGTFWAHFPLRK